MQPQSSTRVSIVSQYAHIYLQFVLERLEDLLGHDEALKALQILENNMEFFLEKSSYRQIPVPKEARMMFRKTSLLMTFVKFRYGQSLDLSDFVSASDHFVASWLAKLSVDNGDVEEDVAQRCKNFDSNIERSHSFMICYLLAHIYAMPKRKVIIGQANINVLKHRYQEHAANVNPYSPSKEGGNCYSILFYALDAALEKSMDPSSYKTLMTEMEVQRTRFVCN